MANICDYLKWRGDLSFKYVPFNEVDNLIFSTFAYLNIDMPRTSSITIKEAIINYLNKYTEKEIISQFTLTENPISFFKLLSTSTRYSNLKIKVYKNIVSKKEEKQFSGYLIELNKTSIYIAYKGTDNNLIGWKEDFNMSYMENIPSQIEALSFLSQNVKWRYRTIYVGGHSKGGNLAVYASVNVKKSIQKRIKFVYNNDGPGFLDEFTCSTNYIKMLPKIVTILPETSIIGMLLNHKEEFKVVKSSQKGIWQHDSLSWQVDKECFITIKEVDETSNKIQKMITDWLQNITKKQREIFINALFDFLEINKLETVEDLAKLKLRKIPKLITTFVKIDEETRKMVIELIKELMREANKNFNRKSILQGLKSFNRKV